LYTCHLNVCLLFKLFVCMSVRPSSVYPSVYCLFVYVSIWLMSVFLYNCMSLSLSFRLLLHMSVSSVCMNYFDLIFHRLILDRRWRLHPPSWPDPISSSMFLPQSPSKQSECNEDWRSRPGRSPWPQPWRPRNV
jgi:hypothetical protein